MADIAFQELLLTFEGYLNEIADRIALPNAGMMFGKAGPSDVECNKRLGALAAAINTRNTILTSVFDPAIDRRLTYADIMYRGEAEVFAYRTSLCSTIWDLIKAGIEPYRFSNPAKYGLTAASVRGDNKKLFLIHVLEALEVLATDPRCSAHKRLDNFSKNIIGGVAGRLELESFKARAREYLRLEPVLEAEAQRVLQQVTAGVIMETEREISRKFPHISEVAGGGGAGGGGSHRTLEERLHALGSSKRNYRTLEERLRKLGSGGGPKGGTRRLRRKARKTRSRK